MFLALREMRRAKVRFGLLIAAIALLVFLILFQQSLQNGLLTSFVGGIRNQSAPVLVYSVDGQRFIQGSVITPDLESAVRASPAVGQVGRIGQGTFTVSTRNGTFDASVIGYEVVDGAALGAPTTLTAGRLAAAPGEAVAPAANAGEGFDIGDTVTVLPGGAELTVVGLARDIQLNAAPTLFVDYVTYLDVVASVNPDAATPLPNVLAVEPAEGLSAAQAAIDINEISLDLDALARSDAADETPGVAEVSQSFQIIFFLYGIVIPCVTGLFFLIITFQKAAALTLLRALGAPARRLVASLLVQALVIVVGGYLVGTLLYYPLSQQQLGGIPLRFETASVIGWAVALIVLGVGSSLIAARRVLRIDPIDATTGADR